METTRTSQLGRCAKNLVLEAELREIALAFRSASVPLVVLKGIPLTRRLYSSLESREILDNDLLVRRRDRARACEILSSLGYAPAQYVDVQTELDLNGSVEFLRHDRHSLCLVADLHTSAFSPVLYPISESAIWARLQCFDLRGVSVSIFDEALTIVHLAHHYARHRLDDPKTLRDLSRAWNLWSQSLGVGQILDLALRLGLNHALEYCLCVAGEHELLEVPAPPLSSKRAARLRRLLSLSALNRLDRTSYARQLLPLMLADSSRAARFVAQLVVPPLQRLAPLYKRRPSWKLFLFYPAYFVRPLARAFQIADSRPTH